MDYLKILKGKKYKLTQPRKLVLEKLTFYPLTISEIKQKIDLGNKKIDLASIYRNLELFLKLGIVRKIDFGDGKKRYEKIEYNDKHHHLVCDNCGKIEDIRLKNEEKIIDEIKMQSNFKVERFLFEIFGLCTKCQNKKS